MDSSRLEAQTAFPGGVIIDNGLIVASGGASITGSTFSSGDIFTDAGNIFSNTGDIFTNTGNLSTNTGTIATNTGDISSNTGNISTLTGDISTLTGTVSTLTGNISTLTGNVSTFTGNISTFTGTVLGQRLSDTGGTTITGGVVTANEVRAATGTVSGLLTVGAGLSVTGGTITAPSATIATVNATATNTATVTSATINNSGRTTTQSLAVGGGGLTVAAGAPVSFGGNRVQNVGTPIAAGDAANKGYVDAALSATGARIDQAFRDNENNTEGIAIAIALGGIALPHDKTFAIAGNIGFYDDKQAIAAQAAVRLDGITTFNAGIGVGFDNTKVGGRVGLSAAW